MHHLSLDLSLFRLIPRPQHRHEPVSFTPAQTRPSFSTDPCQTASICYQTGSISGFFSEEQATIGDLVVNDQVSCSKSLIGLASAQNVNLSASSFWVPKQSTSNYINYGAAISELVELKNGETYNGHLINCDTWMNIHLREVICTSKQPIWRWDSESSCDTAKFIVPKSLIERWGMLWILFIRSQADVVALQKATTGM